MSKTKFLNDPELGIELHYPADWILENNDEQDIVIFRNPRKDAGLLVLKKHYKIAENLDLLFDTLKEIIKCESLSLIDRERNRIGVKCWKKGKEIIIKLITENRGEVIKGVFYSSEDVESEKRVNDALRSLRVYKSSIGYYEVRKKVVSPEYKWFLAVPTNWEVKPYGIFRDGFIACSGRMKVWLDIYPIVFNENLTNLARAKVNKILNKCKIRRIEKSSHGEKQIYEVEYTKENEDYMLIIQFSTYDIEIKDKSKQKIVSESGYIIPKHVRKKGADIARQILNSFMAGPNFLTELTKMTCVDYTIAGLAIVSKLFDINVSEFFEGVMSKININEKNFKQLLET